MLSHIPFDILAGWRRSWSRWRSWHRTRLSLHQPCCICLDDGKVLALSDDPGEIPFIVLVVPVVHFSFLSLVVDVALS